MTNTSREELRNTAAFRKRQHGAAFTHLAAILVLSPIVAIHNHSRAALSAPSRPHALSALSAPRSVDARLGVVDRVDNQQVFEAADHLAQLLLAGSDVARLASLERGGCTHKVQAAWLAVRGGCRRERLVRRHREQLRRRRKW